MNGREVQKIKGFEIYIEGNNNRVEISLNEKSKIFDNAIRISGNRNSLHIDSPNLIANTAICFGKNNNKVFIDSNAELSKADIALCDQNGEDNNRYQLLIGKNFSADQGLLVRIHGYQSQLSIRKNFSCGANLQINLSGARRKISIGDDCMFSWNVYVWATDGHLIFDKTSGKRLNQEQDVTIGNHVWIGRHASVHKGAIVPDGCIVGANSFITKAFRENNAILAGTPAKVVRRNIRWEK